MSLTPGRLEEHVDHHGCDLFSVQGFGSERVRFTELWLRLRDRELMEYERKDQDAFLTRRREHLQSAVEPVAPANFADTDSSECSGGQATSSHTLTISQVVCTVRDGKSTRCTSLHTQSRDSQCSLLTSVF